MDVTIRLHGIAFEWDSDKEPSETNIEKHGVDFEAAFDRPELAHKLNVSPERVLEWEREIQSSTHSSWYWEASITDMKSGIR